MSYFQYHNKTIYYQTLGAGQPLMFLHGDSASSQMFEFILPLYQNDFQIILIDFLGCGHSERVEQFPIELWYDQALQTIALIEYLDYHNVHLIGTSGGAWVAMNAALKRPDLFGVVIADSFDGRRLHDHFSEELMQEREFAMNDAYASQFYQWCHGDDWRHVVEANTQSLLNLVKFQKPLLYKDLNYFKNPLLLTGSFEDKMLRADLHEEYQEILKMIGHGEMCMFDTGDHPVILSQAKEFATVVKNFIKSEKRRFR